MSFHNLNGREAFLSRFLFLRVYPPASKPLTPLFLRGVFRRFGVSLTLQLFQISGDCGD